MPIETDHDVVTAAGLAEELRRFGGQCWYDETRKKIVYRTDEAALRAYMALQREEMEKHSWIESERARKDLKQLSLADWVCRHSSAFARYWRKTHVFVPAPKACDERTRSG